MITEEELRQRAIKLTVNEAAVIAWRDFTEIPMLSYKEIGKRLLRYSGGIGVSGNRAAQIHHKAQRKLKWACYALRRAR